MKSLGSKSKGAVRAVLAFAMVFGSFTGQSLAQTTTASPLKLIELYTSQGCSSCPPADEALGRLIDEQDDLIALEFHVDYWDTLVHGSDGSFADPFSSAAFSERQRKYNAAALKGRPGVYTPQAIVNGRYVAVGSNEAQVAKALGYAQLPALAVQIAPDTNSDDLLVTISGSEENIRRLAGTPVVMARYLDRRTTEITGGENRHRTLTNHNIVTSMTAIGEINGSKATTFIIPRPAEQEGCAVLVQDKSLTPVYAAAACP